MGLVVVAGRRCLSPARRPSMWERHTQREPLKARRLLRRFGRRIPNTVGLGRRISNALALSRRIQVVAIRAAIPVVAGPVGPAVLYPTPAALPAHIPTGARTTDPMVMTAHSCIGAAAGRRRRASRVRAPIAGRRRSMGVELEAETSRSAHQIMHRPCSMACKVRAEIEEIISTREWRSSAYRGGNDVM